LGEVFVGVGEGGDGCVAVCAGVRRNYDSVACQGQAPKC
jgi:hypothetical protein